jgi:hypothetical protein
MTVNVNLLKGLSLFNNLSESQLEKVARLCTKITIYPGQSLFKEREPGHTIFVSMKADLEVLFTAGGDSMMRMEWLGADETLGTIALIPPHTYGSTARGLTEGTLLASNSQYDKIRLMREKKRWNEKQKSRRYDQEVMDEEIWNYQQRQHKITTAQKTGLHE